MTKREGGVRWVRVREKPGKTGELAGMINKSIILLTTLYCLEDFCTHRGRERAVFSRECERRWEEPTLVMRK